MESKPSSSEENLTDFKFPKNKRPKVTSFTINEKNMVISIYKYVKETWPSDKYPYKKEMALKTASILGIGVASVYRVLKDFKEHGEISSPIITKTRLKFIDKVDDFTKSAIRKKIHAFYLKGELPSQKKVLNDVNQDDTLPNFKRTTFQRLVKHLRFKNIKIQSNYALIERDDIVLWRRKYLLKIKEYREQNRRIFYMHDTWVNTGHTVNKTYVDLTIKPEQQALRESPSTGAKNHNSKGRRLIVVHIWNEDGFVEEGSCVFESKSSGDYHELMDAAHFETWFEGVLPKLGENAVLIMDNAPYHTRRKERLPSSNWTKANIQHWLKDKNISFNDNEIKVELLEKVKNVKHRYQMYAVDELGQRYGIEILRLPPFHCDLNPVELIWADIKWFVARNSTPIDLEEVKELLNESMARVTPDRWRKCVEHVHIEEVQFYKLDFIIDGVIDKFIVQPTDSDAESEDSEETVSE